VRTYRHGQIEVFALKGLDLRINCGERVARTGRSGSGKSTLRNVVGLLDSADGGTCLLAGKAVSELDDVVRFLVDAVVSSLIGGVTGLALGFVGVFAGGTALGVTPVVSFTAVVLTIIVAVVVGVRAGIRPAA
jgi:energy-coupling factor transporter ATP-binding protein EcfA2